MTNLREDGVGFGLGCGGCGLGLGRDSAVALLCRLLRPRPEVLIILALCAGVSV